MSAFTKEFVMELAEKAGLEPRLWNHTDAFERFFELAVAAEREACIELTDSRCQCAWVIRARGQE